MSKLTLRSPKWHAFHNEGNKPAAFSCDTLISMENSDIVPLAAIESLLCDQFLDPSSLLEAWTHTVKQCYNEVFLWPPSLIVRLSMLWLGKCGQIGHIPLSGYQLLRPLGAFRVTKLGQNSAKTDFSKRNIYRFHHGVQWRTNGNKKSWVIRLLSPKGAQGPLQVVASIATRSSHYT